jgi:hypothetical protein
MGMMNDTTAQVMTPLLAKTEAAIEAKVTPENREAHAKIVAAGMKFAFSNATHGTLVEGLARSKEPVHDVAVGVVGILMILAQKAQGTMPAPAMVSAGMVLVLHGLDYLEKTKGVKIGNKEIDDSTKLFTTTLLPKIGVTPEVMAKANNTAQNAMKNKRFMAEYSKTKGVPNGNA